jgi:hypothetical protein
MIKKLFLPLLAILTLVMLTGIVTVLSMPVPAPPPAPMAAAPLASSPSYQLNWDVVAQGGSVMDSASFTMYSTTGQNVTTTMSGSTYTLENGFWHGVFENIYKIFLPFITRG